MTVLDRRCAYCGEDCEFTCAESRAADKAAPPDLAEMAWGLIANAYGGDWDLAPVQWTEAAKVWREEYHATLPEPYGEPVAWRYRHNDWSSDEWVVTHHRPRLPLATHVVEALYTAPGRDYDDAPSAG